MLTRRSIKKQMYLLALMAFRTFIAFVNFTWYCPFKETEIFSAWRGRCCIETLTFLYSLSSPGRLLPWRRPPSQTNSCCLWNSRSRPRTCHCNTKRSGCCSSCQAFILKTAVCVPRGLTASWAPDAPQTPPCRRSPSCCPRLKNKQTKVRGSSRVPERPLQAVVLHLLTLLGVGIGLDLQNHRGDGVCVHVVERVGDPLRRKRRRLT